MTVQPAQEPAGVHDLSSAFDVAIIGGGLLGCAAAYYLTRSGARVAVLEQGSVNRQASGLNAGSLHFQLEYRAIQHSTDLARLHAFQLPLVLDAERRWAQLEDELGTPLEVTQEGGLMLAETREELETLKWKAELERSYGLAGELITGSEARKMAPGLSSRVQGALFHPREGHANPRLVTPAFLRAARALGARVFTWSRVVGIKRRGGAYCLQVIGRRARGQDQPGHVGSTAETSWELRADVVLNCAGIWISEVAAMLDVQLPVVPVALQVHSTEPAPRRLKQLIQYVGGRLSMKQMASGNYLIGGGWPSRMIVQHGQVRKDLRPRLNLESMRGNLSLAVRFWPELADLHLIRAWTGMTALTVDQVPLLGEVAGRPGFFVMGGGSAFTLGPTLAHFMSELIIRGSASLDLSPFSPSRFAHLTH